VNPLNITLELLPESNRFAILSRRSRLAHEMGDGSF